MSKKSRRNTGRSLRRGVQGTGRTVSQLSKGNAPEALAAFSDASFGGAAGVSGLAATGIDLENLNDTAAAPLGLERNAAGNLVKANTSGGVPSGILDARRIESARTEAVRQSRLRRARTINKGGTSTSSLGSPIGGVGLTRPKLGNA